MALHLRGEPAAPRQKKKRSWAYKSWPARSTGKSPVGKARSLAPGPIAGRPTGLMAMEKRKSWPRARPSLVRGKNESVTDLVREHERQIAEQAENQPRGGAVSASWTEGSGNNEAITTQEQTSQIKNRCQIEKPLDLLHTRKENVSSTNEKQKQTFHWRFDNDYIRTTEVITLPPSFDWN
jgi:hypothetical protein